MSNGFESECKANVTAIIIGMQAGIFSGYVLLLEWRERWLYY